MIIGLREGARGASVEGLQRVLTSNGQAIDDAELRQQEFGVSTLAALRAFQARHGLPVTDSIDAATQAALLQAEQAVVAAAAAAAIAVPPRGTVEGQLVGSDGLPIP